MLIFGNPWGLLALLAIPAIVAIHLFRRRYRPQLATALFLYGPVRQAPAAGRTRRPLQRSASLLCEILASLAVSWFLSDPHLSSRQTAAHVVLVLDTRRSLQAVADGASCQDRLLAEARTLLGGLDRDDRVTIVASGDPPRLLAGPAARPADALGKLGDWRCASPWHELDEALALAAGLGGVNARMLVLSDRQPSHLPARTGVIARGRPLPTSGFTDVRWLIEAGGERVLARIGAWGGAPRRRELVLLDARGAVIARGAVDLSPGQTATAALAVPAGTGERVELALLGDDPQPGDDAVAVLRPQPRVVTVLVDLDGKPGDAIERAVSASGEARAVRANPELVAPPAHLVITAGAAAGDGAWLLRVLSGEAKPVIGPFLARSGHRVLADLDFTGVLWSGGGALPEGFDTLLVAGETALLGERRRGRGRTLALSCDLARSTLDRHSAWPGLFANLVAARRESLPGPSRPNLLLGQPVVFVLPPGAVAATVIDPAGERATYRADSEGSLLIPALRVAGVHAVECAGDDGAPTGAGYLLNALPLDARLGDLSAAGVVDREAASSTQAEVERSRGAAGHLLPLLAAAMAAAGAWWLFSAREGG